MTEGMNCVSYKDRLFSLKKGQLRGDITTAHQYLTGGVRGWGQALLCVPSNRTRGNTQKLMHRKSHMYMRKDFTVQVTEPWDRLWSLPPWKRSRTVWIQCCAMCSGMTHCSPFQPDPFCDCEMTLLVFKAESGCAVTPKGAASPQPGHAEGKAEHG